MKTNENNKKIRKLDKNVQEVLFLHSKQKDFQDEEYKSSTIHQCHDEMIPQDQVQHVYKPCENNRKTFPTRQPDEPAGLQLAEDFHARVSHTQQLLDNIRQDLQDEYSDQIYKFQHHQVVDIVDTEPPLKEILEDCDKEMSEKILQNSIKQSAALFLIREEEIRGARQVGQNTIARGMMKQKGAKKNYRRQFEFDFDTFIEDNAEQFYEFLTSAVEFCNCRDCKEEKRAIYVDGSASDQVGSDAGTEKDDQVPNWIGGSDENEDVPKLLDESDVEDQQDPDDPDIIQFLGAQFSGYSKE